MKILYNNKMFGLPELGLQDNRPMSQYGWLFVKHPDGGWVSLADIKAAVLALPEFEKMQRLNKIAFHLAMDVLQSDFYQERVDVKEMVDDILLLDAEIRP